MKTFAAVLLSFATMVTGCATKRVGNGSSGGVGGTLSATYELFDGCELSLDESQVSAQCEHRRCEPEPSLSRWFSHSDMNESPFDCPFGEPTQAGPTIENVNVSGNIGDDKAFVHLDYEFTFTQNRTARCFSSMRCTATLDVTAAKTQGPDTTGSGAFEPIAGSWTGTATTHFYCPEVTFAREDSKDDEECAKRDAYTREYRAAGDITSTGATVRIWPIDGEPVGVEPITLTDELGFIEVTVPVSYGLSGVKYEVYRFTEL